jgi:hypothetical protein
MSVIAQFQLAEEHRELRAAIRSLSEMEIAPHAADVDDKARSWCTPTTPASRSARRSASSASRARPPAR